MEDTRQVNVYKMEFMVIDFDDVGLEGARFIIENTKYPNRCLSPTLMRADARNIEWSDEHPLNNHFTEMEAYMNLFPDTDDAYRLANKTLDK